MSNEKIENKLRKTCGFLLKEPRKIASAFPSISLTAFKYESDEIRSAIEESLVLWSLLYQDSELFQEILRQKNAYTELCSENRNVICEKLINEVRGQLCQILTSTENEYVKFVCMVELLPTEVVRQWLWYENVDLQSKESFLRRLTNDQKVSLKHHWDLYHSQEVDMYELPCFTEGWSNKLYRFFKLPYWFQEKLWPKSAIAYSFFGDMGFQLYPNNNNDQKADCRMAKQFYDGQDFRDYMSEKLFGPELEVDTSITKRGEFVVNQESGLYWYLYRSIRSNVFYRKDAKVSLGKRVCPGVWTTYIFWSLFGIVSPIIFGLAAFDYMVTKESAFWYIFGISPLIVMAVYCTRFFYKPENESYVETFWYLVAFMILAAVFFFFLAVTGFPNFSGWVFVLSVLVLGPYCRGEETYKFWQMPVWGKVLPTLLTISVTLNYFSVSKLMDAAGYGLAMFVLYFWKIIFWIAIQVYGYWYLIALIASFVAFTILLSMGLERTVRYYDYLLSTDIRQARGFAYLCQSGMFSVALVSFLAISGFYTTGSIGVDIAFQQLPLEVVFALFLITIFIVITSYYAIFCYNMYDETRRRLFKKLGSNTYIYKPLKSILSHLRMRGDLSEKQRGLLRRIMNKLCNMLVDRENKQYRKIIPWVDVCLRQAKTDQHLQNILIFIGDDYFIENYLPEKVDIEAVQMILRGELNISSLNDLNAKRELEKSRHEAKKAEFLAKIFGFIEKIGKLPGIWHIGFLLGGIWSFIAWVCKGIVNVFAVLWGLNKFCPNSPSEAKEAIK